MANAVKLLMSRGIKSQLFKNYATYLEKELEVPTFCDVYVNVSSTLNIKPLNVHKYHNCDKLIIKCNEECSSLQYDVYGNKIKITDQSEKDANIIYSIKAPVKANLYLNSRRDINIGYFHGDKLYATSTEGSITVDRFQGNKVNIVTSKGDINLNGFIQASTINAQVKEKGLINTGRLQGLNLILKTKEGSILVESCYSYQSNLEIVEGDLTLDNAHKNCNVFVGKGDINITSFDGKLTVISQEGSADIHLSRITEDSELNLVNGALKLRLGDACQDYIKFNIKAEKCDIADNLKSEINKRQENIILIPDINEDNVCLVNCLKGAVFVEGTTWQDMIKLKLNKRKQQ